MKQRKAMGIYLLILGIAVCIAGVGVHIVYLHERYQGFAEHGYYDSFLHYYWAIGKANAFFSVVCGGIPAIAGIWAIKKK